MATLIGVMLVLSACASKRPKPVYGPEPRPNVPPLETTTNPPPVNASPVYGPNVQVPSPTETNGERPHVTLVLGGAGVASFATVGLLKRLQEEDVRIDSIVTTGWPSLFALGYGFLRSIHDVEWLAMRLGQNDFFSSSFFELNKNYSDHEKLSALVLRTLPRSSLEQSQIPLIIAADNTEPASTEIFDRGDWKTPLLKTMSVPGIFRPYAGNTTSESIQSLKGIEVEEAIRRGGKIIVAVEMYDDYLRFLKTADKGANHVFKSIYIRQLRRNLKEELGKAQFTGRIVLNRAPSDFSAKRLAILAGYREGARLARQLRRH